MSKLEGKIDNFLLDNADLLDKLYLIKLHLKLKKLLRIGRPTEDIETLSWEVKYLIDIQKNDRSDILAICEYIDILEKTSQNKSLLQVKQELNSYINELQHGLIINELYINDQTAKLGRNEVNETNYEITFNDVLNTRENIYNKQLVLMKK